MIDAAVQARLTALPIVQSVAGGRVRKQTSDSRLDYPMLVHQQIAAGADEARGVAGAADTFRTLVQIDFFGADADELGDLANGVRAGLDGQINETWGGFSILASIFLDQNDGAFEDQPGLTGLYRIIQQYRITYRET